MKALQNRVSGCKKVERRNLPPEQEGVIREKIIDRLPEQLKLDFTLWTRDAVRQLIQQEAVKKWLDESFPEIRERAMAEKAEIYWGDETGLRSGDVRGRGFAPRGETPIIKATAKYENLRMISAITNQGRVHWMVVDGAVNIERFQEFLKRLIKYSRHKIFLIVDNLKVHHAIKIKQWLQKNIDRIKLFFLSAYSPDLNPDEHLNADLKQGVGSRAPSRSKKNLKVAAEYHLEMLKNSPDRIRAYFKDPAIVYAAL